MHDRGEGVIKNIGSKVGNYPAYQFTNRYIKRGRGAFNNYYVSASLGGGRGFGQRLTNSDNRVRV